MTLPIIAIILQAPLSLRHVSETRPLLIHSYNGSIQSTGSETVDNEYCISFAGDTMLANLGHDYSTSFLRHARDSFKYVRPLLRKCSTVIANLEGPVTKLGPKHDPLRKSPAYSFNMDPLLPYLLVDEGITHVNRANNHLLDRGGVGVSDTTYALEAADLPSFGFGMSVEEAARPLILNMRYQIGITGYSDLYSQGHLPDPQTNQSGVLPVTKEYAGLGRRLLDEHGANLRIAFVHWGENYGLVSTEMKDQAAILIKAGFDIVIGSDGSHSVQNVEIIDGKPVLFNIGNFLFQTPGRFGSSSALPYGLVVHLMLDKETGGVARLELHCTHIDNKVVYFQPRICTARQAVSLFSTLGPEIVHEKNNTFATVQLKGMWR